MAAGEQTGKCSGTMLEKLAEMKLGEKALVG